MRRLSFIFIYCVFNVSCSGIDIKKQTAVGLRQYDHDSLQQSITTLSKVIAVTDSCSDCLLYRGFAYKDLKQYNKAIKDFTSMLAIDTGKNKAIGYANRASVYYLQFDYKSALRDFTAAYNADSSEDLLNPICHMLFANGYKDSACIYYQRLSAKGDTTFDESIKTYCAEKNKH